MPPNVPRDTAPLLLIAVPPIVAATLSLRAFARPHNVPRAEACELLTASPRSATATDVLLAVPHALPIAVEFESATPPLVAPAYASETALPTAVELELADPPFVATDVALASAPKEAAATVNIKPFAQTVNLFMATLPIDRSLTNRLGPTPAPTTSSPDMPHGTIVSICEKYLRVKVSLA
jgi:hypothetical protein